MLNAVMLNVVILSVVAPYASIVVTYPSGAPYDVPLFWYSPANATLGWKGFPETNALAYLYIASLQQKKVWQHSEQIVKLLEEAQGKLSYIQKNYTLFKKKFCSILAPFKFQKFWFNNIFVQLGFSSIWNCRQKSSISLGFLWASWPKVQRLPQMKLTHFKSNHNRFIFDTEINKYKVIKNG